MLIIVQTANRESLSLAILSQSRPLRNSLIVCSLNVRLNVQNSFIGANREPFVFHCDRNDTILLNIMLVNLRTLFMMVLRLLFRTHKLLKYD